MFMTDAACQRCSESRATQSRTGPASPGGPAIRCGQATCEGMFHIPSSSPSLSRTSSASEVASSGQRSQAGIHRQASPQSGPTRAHVCRGQRIVHQRGGQPSVARAAATRTRAWVRRNQVGNAPSSWNIDLTVCCPTNSRTCMSCSSPIDASQSEEKLRNKRILHQE